MVARYRNVPGYRPCDIAPLPDRRIVSFPRCERRVSTGESSRQIHFEFEPSIAGIDPFVVIQSARDRVAERKRQQSLRAQT